MSKLIFRKVENTKISNETLFAEMQQRGFYVSKISQEKTGIDYLVVSAEPIKVKEVFYSDIKEWPISSTIGQD